MEVSSARAAISPCSFWHLQLQARACPKLADAGAALRSGREHLDQCWAAEGAAQACDWANTHFGVVEGVSSSSWQWQVPSVFPDVLGDGLPDLNNINNSSEYTGFIWCVCFQRLWEACVRFWWICLSVIHAGTETAFETTIYTLQLKARFYFFFLYPVPVKSGDCSSCFTNLWFQFCFDIPPGMHVNLLPSCTTLFWKKVCFLAWLLITAVLIVCTFHGELNNLLIIVWMIF